MYKTVRQRAESIKVQQQKVLAWIARGELIATDVSESRGGRPRWRISDEDWQQFLTSRSNQSTISTATNTTKRKRRTDPGVIQFY